MARRNPDKQAQEASPEQEQAQQPPEGAPATTPAEARQPGDEPGAAPKREFEPVRGWTRRLTGPLKYRKFADANMRVIAFKFMLEPNEKPPEEVLALLKSNTKDKEGNATGLKYQNSRTHGPIWTIPNDVEGRTLADRIDFRLSEIAQKMHETPGQGPAF